MTTIRSYVIHLLGNPRTLWLGTSYRAAWANATPVGAEWLLAKCRRR